ncbi:MAG: hypothetical protein ABWY22_08510 [Flavobacterium sp.]
MVNKRKAFIRNNAKTIAFLLVYIVFIYLKVTNLDNYYFYDGKVTGLYKVVKSHSTGARGSVLIGREIPEIEYYKNNDTIKCDQGDLRLVTNFEVNEKIKVLEDKDNNYETKIYSLFYYWIDFNELILFLFAFLFILGFIKNFI